MKISEKHAVAGTNKVTQGWEPEYTVVPSERSLIRAGLVGIRFRSAVAGTPAQIICTVFAPHEG